MKKVKLQIKGNPLLQGKWNYYHVLGLFLHAAKQQGWSDKEIKDFRDEALPDVTEIEKHHPTLKKLLIQNIEEI